MSKQQSARRRRVTGSWTQLRILIAGTSFAVLSGFPSAALGASPTRTPPPTPPTQSRAVSDVKPTQAPVSVERIQPAQSEPSTAATVVPKKTATPVSAPRRAGEATVIAVPAQKSDRTPESAAPASVASRPVTSVTLTTISVTPSPRPTSPAPTPTQLPTPSAPPILALPTLAPTLAPIAATPGRATSGVRASSNGKGIALEVPIRTQLDGTDYQSSNCGPASLGMVLDAFGLAMPTSQLRQLANILQGTFDRETGIALDYLGEIARKANLQTYGLKEGTRYRRWAVEDLRSEIRRGHPIITLVRLRELPDHEQSRADTDHYIVIVGLDGTDLIFNDPARPGDLGSYRRISPTQLERAWDTSSIPRQALSFGAPLGVPEVQFGGAIALAPQIGMAVPAVAESSAQPMSDMTRMVLPPIPEPTDEAGQPFPPTPFSLNTTDTVSTPPIVPGPASGLAQPAAFASGGNPGPGQPILVYITPAAQSQPIIVNVHMPSLAPPMAQGLVTPIPAPTQERWARPVAGFSPRVASANVPASTLGTGYNRWTVADGNLSRNMLSSESPPALVLGQTGPPPVDLFWRWFIRIGMIAGGGVFLRRLWR